MLISVVIPVYNTSSYLARCIDSIFEQDLKDVELIFIDDCSTDNSFEVAIIPYTFEHTNFHDIHVGSMVNLEFDIIGKYIARIHPD